MIALKNGQYFSGDILLNSLIMAPIIVVVLFWQLLKLKKTQRISWVNVGLLVLLSLYLYLLMTVTLFPINLFPSDAAVYQSGFGQQMNLLNFDVTALLHYQPDQILDNLIMVAPLTFLLAGLKPQRANWRWSFKVGFLTSLTIETLQLLLNFFYLGSRLFDINDLLLNTIGAMLGYGVFVLVKQVGQAISTLVHKS